MVAELLNYKSYLLRLWPTRNHSEWRATLTCVQDPDEQHHFSSLDALTLFLNDAARKEPVYHSQEVADEGVSNVVGNSDKEEPGD